MMPSPLGPPTCATSPKMPAPIRMSPSSPESSASRIAFPPIQIAFAPVPGFANPRPTGLFPCQYIARI